MSSKKRSFGIIAGLLMMSATAFEINTLKRYIEAVAGGESGYMGELVVETVYILAIIFAGVFFVLGRMGKGAGICLCVASGVALYRVFVYMGVIAGNAMIVSIVAGNVISIAEFALFAIPVAIMVFMGKNISEKAAKGFLICIGVALAVAIGGRIAYFLGYGKNFFVDMGLFFGVYWKDLLRSIVTASSAVLAVKLMSTERRKKRR